MKKTVLFSFLLIINTAYSQGPMKDMLKTYFRVHPFNMKFSTFILNLQQDPWFTIEEFNRRTDTTFFYISGSYKNFNPFRFAPTQIKLVVAEQELIHIDSLHTLDTVVNLQLMAITDTTAANKSAVIKEFKRFRNNQAGHFFNTNYNKLVKELIPIAEIQNYFVYPLSIAPVTAAWGFLPETNQCIFNITVRFKLNGNIAYYIAAPWELFGGPIE